MEFLDEAAADFARDAGAVALGAQVAVHRLQLFDLLATLRRRLVHAAARQVERHPLEGLRHPKTKSTPVRTQYKSVPMDVNAQVPVGCAARSRGAAERRGRTRPRAAAPFPLRSS